VTAGVTGNHAPAAQAHTGKDTPGEPLRLTASRKADGDGEPAVGLDMPDDVVDQIGDQPVEQRTVAA
jgi:hypothetical protein